MKLQVGDVIFRTGFNTKYDNIMIWLFLRGWDKSYTSSRVFNCQDLIEKSDWVWFRLPALNSELINCLTQVEL